MAGNNGGPWGGNGGNKGNNGNRPPRGPQNNEIDELMKKGQEQLRSIMGGRSGASGTGGAGTGGEGLPKWIWLLLVPVLFVFWLFASFYRVDTSEQSVELFLGEYYRTGTAGLNFAPWPIVTKEIVPVTREQIENIGVGGRTGEEGLMLTGDENIVDIDFQVVWNINDPAKFLFNLAAPQETIRVVSESVMREIVARTDLTPILTTGKVAIAAELHMLIQQTLDEYDSGVNIVRVNFDRADPPLPVADSFRDVQAAEQTRDTLEKQADAYYNEKVAGARGEAAQMIAQAQAYSARVVNEAEGEASRFLSVFEEYQKAPDVTRMRLYLETMEQVLGDMDKIILDGAVGGDSGVLPYLPLNELRKNSTGGTN